MIIGPMTLLRTQDPVLKYYESSSIANWWPQFVWSGGGGLTPLPRCGRRILQPQPTGREKEKKKERQTNREKVRQKQRHVNKSSLPQAVTLLGGAMFITWRLKRPFYRNADGTGGIFGAFELRPSARTHLKSPCATLVRWVRRTTNTKRGRKTEIDSIVHCNKSQYNSYIAILTFIYLHENLPIRLFGSLSPSTVFFLFSINEKKKKSRKDKTKINGN